MDILRRRIEGMKNVIFLVILVCSIGCASTRGWIAPPSGMGTISDITSSTPVQTCSPMLGWLGGICTLGGMALIVLTGGRMGWKPAIAGIIFIVINYALSLYANWIFLPVVIATGAISIAWAGKIIWKIVNDDEIKIKEIF